MIDGMKESVRESQITCLYYWLHFNISNFGLHNQFIVSRQSCQQFAPLSQTNKISFAKFL
jgi:hypothetical protein